MFSALAPKADSRRTSREVRFLPKPEVAALHLSLQTSVMREAIQLVVLSAPTPHYPCERLARSIRVPAARASSAASWWVKLISNSEARRARRGFRRQGSFQNDA
jgi:hypothetical protein